MDAGAHVPAGVVVDIEALAGPAVGSEVPAAPPKVKDASVRQVQCTHTFVRTSITGSFSIRTHIA